MRVPSSVLLPLLLMVVLHLLLVSGCHSCQPTSRLYLVQVGSPSTCSSPVAATQPLLALFELPQLLPAVVPALALLA